MRARIPFGYRIRNGRAEPDPVEAQQLQLLFSLFLQGMSAAASAREAGIPRSAVCCRKMLSNPVYCGTDYYPQLISPAQMEAVEKIRQKNIPPVKGKPGRKPQFPLPAHTQFSLSAPPGNLPDVPSDRAAFLYSCIQTADGE